MSRRKINIRPVDVARTTALTVPRTMHMATSKKRRAKLYAGKVNSCSLQSITRSRLTQIIPWEIPLESPFKIQVCYNCLCSREIPKFPDVGGKSVRQADVSGGTHFPRKFCPTGQDILSVLG